MDRITHLYSTASGIEVNFDAVRRAFNSAATDIFDRDAYAHPNGFLVLELFDSPDGGKMRLHVWIGNDAIQDDHAIHDHVYNFRSIVMMGGIKQTRFLATRAIDGPFVAYSASYDSLGSIIEASDRRYEAVVTDIDHYIMGDVYELRAGEFHSISVKVIPSATIFLKRPADGPPSPTVLGVSNNEERLHAPRNPIDRTISREILQRAFADL